jgi:DNA-binding NarL/FixJ family response regulator
MTAPSHQATAQALAEAAAVKAATLAGRAIRVLHLARQGLTVAEIARQTGFSHRFVGKAVARARALFDGAMGVVPPCAHGGEAAQ